MTTTQPLELLAPLSGVLLALDQVPDPVFASRMIGDGLCIDPTSQTLCAPLAGVISSLQDSGHAVSVTDDNGVQVLMHIGLDTVNLAGQGFTRLVQEGQRVDAGQPLIEFDADYVALTARSLLTLMLVVSGEPFTLLAPDGNCVDVGQPLLRVSPGEATAAVAQEEGEALFSKPLSLPNANGLHARPAAVLAQAAKGFEASIYLHKQTQSANAKSLVAIMALQTAQGDTLQVSAAGNDADAAIKALVALLAEGCGETVAAPAQVIEAVAPVSSAALLRGVCASPGSAFGQVVQVAEPELNIIENGTGETAERDALTRGLLAATEGAANPAGQGGRQRPGRNFQGPSGVARRPDPAGASPRPAGRRQKRRLCLEQRHRCHRQAVPGPGQCVARRARGGFGRCRPARVEADSRYPGPRMGLARAGHPDRRATDAVTNRQPGYAQGAGVCHCRRRRDQSCGDPRPCARPAGDLRCARAGVGTG